MPKAANAPQVDINEKLKPFEFHGCDFTIKGTQGISDCPLCGKPEHFFVNKINGMFDCKRCLAKGNIFSFLSQYHANALENTTDEDYAEMSQLRNGIYPEIYKQEQVAKDGQRWLYPIRNDEGKIVTLRAWVPGQKFHTTSGLPVELYGREQFKTAKPEQIFVLTEGEHDRLALLAALRKAGNETYLVFAPPGAGTFKTEWVEKFKGRHVIILFDNDAAGQKGIENLEKKLAPIARKLERVQWPEGATEGYDVNDFIAERLKTPRKAISDLLELLVPSRETAGTKLTGNAAVSAVPVIKPEDRPRIFKQRPSFAQVIKEFKTGGIYLNHDMEVALATLYAVAISNQIKTDCPIWLFIVAPPGAGKTLITLTMSDAPSCMFLSNLKPHAIISGFKPNNDPNDDPSLLPKLIGKTLAIKDYTEVLSLPLGTQEELYGILRGAYDGRAEVIYGNGVHRIYDNCHFSLAAAVTPAIQGSNRASLGERFLKLNMIRRENHDKVAHIRASLNKGSNVAKYVEVDNRLKQVSYEFLDVVIDPKKLPKIPAEFNNRLINLAQLLSYLRADVTRGHGGELTYSPEAEIGTRPAKQLDKLARSLAFVYGKTVVDQVCYSIIENVALDSANSWNLRIATALSLEYPNAMEVSDVAFKTELSYSNVNRRMENMIELGMLQRKLLPKNAGRGRSSYGYTVTQHFFALWKNAKLDTKRFAAKKPTKS